VDSTRDSLVLAERVMRTLEVHPDRMKAATDLGFLTATEIADELVRRGVSFGEAHEQVGFLVRYCTENGKRFHDLTDDEARRCLARWDPKLRQIATSLELAVRRKNVFGGTAPGQVARQLKEAEDWNRRQRHRPEILISHEL
jgi:argininosuccinate lyase